MVLWVLIALLIRAFQVIQEALFLLEIQGGLVFLRVLSFPAVLVAQAVLLYRILLVDLNHLELLVGQERHIHQLLLFPLQVQEDQQHLVDLVDLGAQLSQEDHVLQEVQSLHLFQQSLVVPHLLSFLVVLLVHLHQ